MLKFYPAGAFNAYETHHNCSIELTLDWVSEEREELENLRVFDILVKQAGTKENDRSRGLTKDQSPLSVVSSLNLGGAESSAQIWKCKFHHLSKSYHC